MKLKFNVFFILLIITLFPINIYASDIDWPINIEADEKTTTAIKEESIPQTTEDIKKESNTSTSAESLSPIEDKNIEVKESKVFGDDYNLVDRLTQKAETNENLSDVEKIYSNYSNISPVITLDQIIEWILKKGNETISILQLIAQPIAIIFFIISAAVCLFGTLTKGNLTGKGFMGMIFSGLLYAACLYAPVLVNSFTSFLAG